MKESICRRDFVAGASALGAGALLTSLSTTPSEAKASVQQTDDITWTDEADIIVLGFGSAGCGAIKDAVDLGADVIVLERSSEDSAGGSLRCNGGNWAYVTPLCYTNCSFGAIGQELADQMYDESWYYAEWLGENGVEWTDTYASDNEAVVMQTANGWGYAVWKAVHDFYADSEHVRFYYSTPATDLVKNDTGEVIGVVSETDGTKTYFKARRGVIIATGSYASNSHLIQGNHFACLDYASCTSPDCNGDGIFLAAKAGASVLQDVSLCVEFFGWALRTASEELGTAVVAQEPQFRQGDYTLQRIFVNGKGKRFMREDYPTVHDKSTNMPFLYYDNIKDNAKGGTNIGNGYVNMPMWAIYDSTVLEQGPLQIIDDWTWCRTQNIYEWSQDNQAEIERGWILKADTIEELAALMKSTNSTNGEPVEVDPAELAATIEEYNNTICASGSDPLGKDPKYLVPIVNPPFYATELVPSIGYTNNGVSVNELSQVIDWYGQPIPRLYAAGDICSQMRAYLLGMNGCWVRGAIASRHAMTLEPLE